MMRNEWNCPVMPSEETDGGVSQLELCGGVKGGGGGQNDFFSFKSDFCDIRFNSFFLQLKRDRLPPQRFAAPNPRFRGVFHDWMRGWKCWTETIHQKVGFAPPSE